MNAMFDPIKGKPLSVFFYYSIPSVLSMMAISSVVIIDGFFIGRHIGAHALAGVNLTVPVHTLLIGIALMMSVGGAARCGRSLGRRDVKSANLIFSQTLIVISVIAATATVLGLIFMPSMIRILGANPVLYGPTFEYLRIMVLFFICPMGIVCLSSFLRVDGHPMYAAWVMVSGSLLNVFLDWLFIADFGWGLSGAALGTGLSELATLVCLAIPFLKRKTRLRFFWNTSDLFSAAKSAGNGFPEFSNEVSAALITFVFNWVIMQRLGETGVAAFSVINYIILGGIIIHCGISEAIQPVVSKNFGALRPRRIVQILGISTLATVCIGGILSAFLRVFPQALIGVFFQTAHPELTTLATAFMSCIWPIFLLNGVNIVAGAYLTAVNLSVYSTAVSLSRNLFLPGLFLMILPEYAGHKGIFLALPLSEFITCFIALYILKQNSPSKLLSRSVSESLAPVR